MKEPYIQINAILGAVLLLIFCYSFLYPWLSRTGAVIPSGCEGLPEAYCKSRGLTRAFAAITHGQWEQAPKFNAYSISIFSFFALQLLARPIFSALFLRFKKDTIIYFDALASAVYFLWSFLPMTMT